MRLKGYDYSAEGSYFITIVTHDRLPLFGSVVDGEMVLSEYGKIVDYTWYDLVNHNPDIGLDEFVIMPNHIHGIIIIYPPYLTPNTVGAGSSVLERGCDLPAHKSILGNGCPPGKPAPPTPTDTVKAGSEPAPTKTRTPLSEIVRQFKTFSAKRINQIRDTPATPVWQRNYYDHIIGTDCEYEQITAYIANNPANWLTDDENAPAGC